MTFPVLPNREQSPVKSKHSYETSEQIINPEIGVGQAEQIAELHQAIAILQERDLFFQLSLDALCIIGFDGFFKQLNPAWEKILGFSSAELKDQPFINFVHPKDREATLKEAERIGQGMTVLAFENRYCCKDGSYRWLQWQAIPLLDQRMMYAIARDVTDRKEAELALQESETRLRNLLDISSDWVWEVDAEGRYTFVSDRVQAILGYSPEEMIGKTLFDTMLPEEAARVAPIFGAIATAQRSFRALENICLAKNGHKVYLETSGVPIFDEDGQFCGYRGIDRDVSDRKQGEAERKAAEEALRQSQVRLATLMSNLPGMAYTCKNDENWTMTFISEGAYPLTGFRAEDLLHNETLSFNDLIHPEDRDLVWKTVQYTLSENRPFQLIYRIRTATGSEKWVWEQGRGIYNSVGELQLIEGFITDVTDRQKANLALRQKAQELEQTLTELGRTQAQLVQSEKMSSLGQLVAGVAHEINNPVNFIYGNLNHANNYIQDLLGLVRLYERHYPHPAPEVQEEINAIDLNFLMEDLPKLLNSMKVGADRIQKIVASLRSFSRMDEAEVKSVDLHEGIESTLLILQNRLKARPESTGIQILREYGELPQVECYAGQLNQVFMNIISNAIDALEEKGEKLQTDSSQALTIQIRTRVLSSGWVAIHIIDNGSGIPEAVQKHIFDPFYTTKPVGKGTGLGMSISYQIVTERHRGRLRCQSELGQGTEFVIEIPVHQQ